MSYDRAISLKTMLDALREAHPVVQPERPPFPLVVALIEPGIALGESADLPAEYTRLLVAVTVVPDTTTLDERSLQTAQEPLRFASTLFAVLRRGHDAALVFGREGGCTSIATDSITAGGGFADAYYLDSTADLGSEELEKRQASDLVAALRLTWEVSGPTAFAWQTILQTALSAYLAVPLSHRLNYLSEDACNALAVSGPEHADVIFTEIADSVLASVHGRESSN